MRRDARCRQAGDSRLEEAYELIDAGRVRLLSLDIFDTLLWRKVPFLLDLFLILGREFKAGGWLIPAVSVESFVPLRSGAEQLARSCKSRHTKGCSEVNLRDIYAHLTHAINRISITDKVHGKRGIVDESDLDNAIDIEVAVENRLIGLDQDIVALAAYARNHEIPVVLVSDTYFNLDRLRLLLDRPAAWGSSLLNYVDAIYASCEYGCGKTTGLLEKMLNDRACAPERVLHVGDSIERDHLPAARLGIRTILYQRCDDALRRTLSREWPGEDLQTRLTMLDDCQGDFGLSCTRGKLRYSQAATDLSARDAFFWKHGASILAPIIAGVVLWAHERCREMGQDKVFCLMREGNLYADVLTWFSPYLKNHHVEPVRLWINRHYIANACLESATAEEIGLALTSSVALAQPYTVESFCLFLGLPGVPPPYRKYAGVLLFERSFCRELCEYLSSNSLLKEQIVAGAAAKRRRYVRYLQKVVDLDGVDQITLLDIGWRGTAQRALQILLRLSGYTIDVHGLYLGTLYGTGFAALSGQALEGFLLHAGQPPGDVNVVKRGVYVLEEVAIADCDIMDEISDDGTVLVEKPLVGKRQQREALIAQQGIKAFCEALGEKILAGDICWDSSAEALRKILRSIAVGFTGLPTREESTRYSHWRHDPVSAKDGRLVSLGDDPYYKRFIKDMTPGHAFSSMDETWHSSYAARIDPFLALAWKAESEMTLPARCFLSQDYLTLSVFLDRGLDFPKSPAKRLLLRSNANRSYYAYQRFFSSKRAIKRIKLVLPFKGLVRVLSLRFDLNHQGAPEIKRSVFFEEPESDLAGLQVSPAPVASGVFRSTGKHPLEIVYCVDVPDVFLIQLRFCCEIFSIPV